MKKESPEFVKLSLAGAMTLGFRPGRFWRDARMTCINLLLHYDDGCAANCSYCGLARRRQAKERTFIHVPWPLESLTDIIARINASDIPRRTCISMIIHRRTCEDTLAITRRLAAETHIPVSILLAPTITNRDYLESLRIAGARKIGIAIDAATPELFAKHRGPGVQGPHKWPDYWQRLHEAAEIFGPENVSSHFVCGLGEREEDLVHCFFDVHSMGGENHLFSFYPEPGSCMGEVAPPPLDMYRRIQIACHLVDAGLTSPDAMRFDPVTGRILDFGVSHQVLDATIESGEPFRTRGCRGCDGEVDCNRPYGNSFPGPLLRNYPFRPEPEDIRLIRSQFETLPDTGRRITFFTPTFKHYDTDLHSNRGQPPWPAVSVTGKQCRLLCDHCRAGLLQPMIDARTPEALWNAALSAKKNGATGLLVSGGCDSDGQVPLAPFCEVMAHIRKDLDLRVAVHSKFVRESLAKALAAARIETLMVDVVTDHVIQNIYHLSECSLKNVVQTLDLAAQYDLPLSPHLILGMNGDMPSPSEQDFLLLDLLLGRALRSLVIVFLMPLPRTPLFGSRPVSLPETSRFFARARAFFPKIPVLLGCARPPGPIQSRLEALAMKHRFDGIAFPSEQTILRSRKRGYNVRFEGVCCALYEPAVAFRTAESFRESAEIRT